MMFLLTKISHQTQQNFSCTIPINDVKVNQRVKKKLQISETKKINFKCGDQKQIHLKFKE